MNGFLVSALAFVLAIGVLVAVHEFGHFWVARRLGVRVLRYSIGFGTALWSRTARDGTEYRLSALPLGGYVKLLDEREGEVPPAELHRAFNRQSPPRRIAILAAGPAFNFLFAIVAYWLMFVVGVPAMKPLVGDVRPESPAARAGIERGDQIVAVDGEDTPTLMAAQLELLDAVVRDGRVRLTLRDEGGQTRETTLQAEGEIRALTEPGALFPGLGFSPWQPQLPPVVGELSADGSAASSGLAAGDRILSAAGDPVETWSEWVQLVRARPGQTLDIVIERDGRETPLALAIGSVQEDGTTIGRIGAAPQVPPDLFDRVRTEERFGPFAAVGRAVVQTWDMSALTVKMVGRMIAGDVSLKNVSGPINIAQVAGYTASAGLTAFLSFLAIISVSLGIINLFPIPLLDGGQIAFQVAEMVKGSPVSERAQLIGQQVGIVLLIVLMSFAFYNDIVRLAAD